MAESSAATAAAAWAPGLRAGGRGGGRPWGRQAEGGRRRAGGGERGRAAGEGAGAAAAAAGLPASLAPCAPRSLGRCSSRCPPRSLASPGLAAAARPGRASSRPPGRLSASLFLLPPPPSTQIPTPQPKPRSRRRRRRRHTPLGLGLARLPRWPRPAPTSLSLALPRPCFSPSANRTAALAAEAPPTLPGSSRIGAAGTGVGAAPTRTGWASAARDVSTAPPPPPPGASCRAAPATLRATERRPRLGPLSRAGCLRRSLRLGSRLSYKQEGSPIKRDLRRLLVWWSFFLAGREGVRRKWCRNRDPRERPNRSQNSTRGEETSSQEVPHWVPTRLTRPVETAEEPPLFFFFFLSVAGLELWAWALSLSSSAQGECSTT
ncbi:laforin-like [Dipodomys merriami]|uniref:laforin-like n=1 Tax=Dipodomys merriami TaxID=94247 RepID=UPI003855E540